MDHKEDEIVVVAKSCEKYNNFQETIETLAHPVEVDNSDILKILSRIEGVSLHDEKPLETRPQLIITDFRIDRKKPSLYEVYALNIKILKREYTQNK